MQGVLWGVLLEDRFFTNERASCPTQGTGVDDRTRSTVLVQSIFSPSYKEKDFEAAADFFSHAIKLMESRWHKDTPRDAQSKAVLGILYGNRCQCFLALARERLPTLKDDMSPPQKQAHTRRALQEVKQLALRANKDAVTAHGLDPTNEKNFHRRGQAMLLLSHVSKDGKRAGK